MPNAIEMLRQDHHKMRQLFDQFEQAGDAKTKEQICQQTLQELEMHTALEEELFYPAASEQIDEKEMISEALEEHHVAKLLVNELKKMRPSDERFDAKYKVLAETVTRHVQEEESEVFPMLEDGLDVEGIGEQMEARKQKLAKKVQGAPRQAKGRTRSKTAAKRGRSRAAGGRKRARASSSRR